MTPMEEKFAEAWLDAQDQAKELGIRVRPMEKADALKNAHRCLQGSRVSDGFDALAEKGRLDLSLEVLAVDRRFGELFSDDEANEALARLLEAGYFR